MSEGTQPGVRDEDWRRGFELGPSGGLVCDVCRCLVRQTRGDAEAHRSWHASLGER